ncbi:hypothetical protein KC19_2G070300 [Ceratodon purpureus]|uniref:Uncharacterized protein n=1 Tax=Ceratodon purpureus TaxID=3225 RepID=A0A8T0IST1_CERPU|nr:hypothetical protein KC19_2G070300 [Ceratodon purpureus]
MSMRASLWVLRILEAMGLPALEERKLPPLSRVWQLSSLLQQCSTPLDHCLPGMSRLQNLKRLATHKCCLIQHPCDEGVFSRRPGMVLLRHYQAGTSLGSIDPSRFHLDYS